MANTRELRRRIRSVGNTAQITRAMEMVSASKMRRAQEMMFAGRPYADQVAAPNLGYRRISGSTRRDTSLARSPAREQDRIGSWSHRIAGCAEFYLETSSDWRSKP